MHTVHTMNSLSKLYALILILAMACCLAPAQEQDPYSTEYIEQAAATLQNDIKRKNEFIKLYDSRRTEYIKLRNEFRSRLRQKEVRMYTQDYQNVFNLSSAYKEAITFPKEFQERLLSTIQVDKVLESAKADQERVRTLKENLASIDATGLAPEIIQERDKAIEYCDTLNQINAELITRATEDSNRLDYLKIEINNLNNEGIRIKGLIQNTLTGRSIYTQHVNLILPILRESIKTTYSADTNTNLRASEFSFLLRALAISLIISIAGSWFIFKVALKKTLKKHGAFARTPFLILVGTLMIFSLALASLNKFGRLDYYQSVTALGPEFLLTVTFVVLALSVRLREKKFWTGILLYLPMIIISGALVALRLTSAPNIFVVLTLPFVSLAMACCSGYILYRTKKLLPRFDVIMGSISLIFLTIATFISWAGYAYISFLLLLFWNILMCCILFIMAFIAIVEHYRQRRRDRHMEKKSWFIPFCYRLFIPILSVFMLIFSLYWPMEVFDLGDDFIRGLGNHNIVAESAAAAGQQTDAAAASTNNLARNITPNSIINIILLAIIINYLTYLGKKWLRDVYGDNYEQSGMPTLVTIANLIIWSVFIIIALVIVGANFNGIFVVLGGMSLGLGFALKDTIENIICGISLMFGRLRQGDYVECDGIRGRVLSLGYRSTYMETLDGSIIAFQNTQLFNKNFRNLTQNHMYEAAGVKVGVAYSTDIENLKQIILDAIHNVELISKTRSPGIFFDDFGDDAVIINVVVWVPVPSKGSVLSEVREQIYNALNENGISIPFPQRDIYVKEFPQQDTGKPENEQPGANPAKP